jgi:signal recognition particle receptor subunit beta
MTVAPPPNRTKPPQRDKRERRQASDVVKVIVTGLAQSGKSSFIQRISQYTESQDDSGSNWFFGRVRVDSSLILHFLEPPMGRQFDFMWLRDVMSRVRATGFVVMVDSSKPHTFGEFLSILYTIRGYHENAPLVVAANKQDKNSAWGAEDIRLGLGIRDVRVMPCVAEDHNLVRDVVIDLLYQTMNN